jgi:hypothetical protein
MRKTIRKLFCLPICLLLALSILISSAPAQAAPASETGLKWTTQTADGAGGWRSVVWSPELDKFVAVGVSSTFPNATVRRIMTSSDAKTWTLVPTVNLPAGPGVWTSVVWSPQLNLFVTVACGRTTQATCVTSTNSNLRVLTSTDGTTWAERTTPDDNSAWQSVTWSPQLGLFVGVADGGGNSVMTSPDGINWAARTAPEDNAWKSVIWSPERNLFVAVAGSGTNRIMTSPDGITWTPRAASEANTWTSVVWSPERALFVAVSSDGTNRVMTSPDGITWTPRSASAANAWSSVAWSPQLQTFTAVANSGTDRIMTSSDGINWTGQSASMDNAWNGITWSPGINAFVAVASTGGSGVGTPRVMTGAMITASTNDPTNVESRSATFHGDYQDSFVGSGVNVFFRYRLAGSSDPYTETTPQSVTNAGTFTDTISSLTPDNTTYEYKAVVQWPGASATQTLEGGLQTFTTLYADDDNDSIYNIIEDAAPNNGDANNDGTLDSTQPFVASLVNPITNEYAVLELDSVCQLEATAVQPESNNATADPLFEYPVGLMSFTADCGTPGYTTTVTQYYYGTSGEFELRKYNPNSNTYFTLDDATQQVANIGGQSAMKAMFAVTDGGGRDMDGTADGIITDPAGLAIAVNDSGTVTPGSSEPLANTGQNSLPIVLAAVFLIASGIVYGRTLMKKHIEL